MGPDDPSFVDFMFSLKILCVFLQSTQCLSQGLLKNGRIAARQRSREASSGTSWQVRVGDAFAKITRKWNCMWALSEVISAYNFPGNLHVSKAAIEIGIKDKADRFHFIEKSLGLIIFRCYFKLLLSTVLLNTANYK